VHIVCAIGTMPPSGRVTPDPNLDAAPVPSVDRRRPRASSDDAESSPAKRPRHDSCSDLLLSVADPDPGDGPDPQNTAPGNSAGLQQTRPQPPSHHNSDTNTTSHNNRFGEEAVVSSDWCWFDLPAELRNMIYEYSLQWPTSLELYAGYNRRIDSYYARKLDGADEEFPEPNIVLGTPTILLLCRRVTAECLPILRSRRFVIDRLPPWLPGARRPMLVSQFIGRRTIQNISHLEIRLPVAQGLLGSAWVWVGIAIDILDILRERNTFKDLRIIICIFENSDRNSWDNEVSYLAELTKAVCGCIPGYDSLQDVAH